MKLSWRTGTLVLSEPFRISRSVMYEREAVWLELEQDGLTGRGEAVTSVYYDLDAKRIAALLESVRNTIEDSEDPERLLGELSGWAGELRNAPGVLAAVDAALHDLAAQRRGMAVHELVGTPCQQSASTACTIGISSTARSAEAAANLVGHGFELLKVKLGASGEQDELARLAAIREVAPRARILLDPNGAWSPEQALRMLEGSVEHGVVAAEQPIRPGTPDKLAWVAQRSPVPIIADEDAATATDVLLLGSSVHGVNVKLPKCGGIRAALGIVEAARAVGMEVMLGCLVASSLGIAPAVHLTGFARWVDLDGHLLLANDPWAGIGGSDGVLRVEGATGLGVRPAESSFDEPGPRIDDPCGSDAILSG